MHHHLHWNHILTLTQNNLFGTSPPPVIISTNRPQIPSLSGQRDRQWEKSQSEEAAPWQHTGVNPTSHDTKALRKLLSTRCHCLGDVGIARQIQASQSRVRNFTPTYLGTVTLHCHDSNRLEKEYKSCIVLIEHHFPLMRKEVFLLLPECLTLTLNLDTWVAKILLYKTEQYLIATNAVWDCTQSLLAMCYATCYVSLPHPSISICFSVFLSLMVYTNLLLSVVQTSKPI